MIATAFAQALEDPLAGRAYRDRTRPLRSMDEATPHDLNRHCQTVDRCGAWLSRTGGSPVPGRPRGGAMAGGDPGQLQAIRAGRRVCTTKAAAMRDPALAHRAPGGQR